MVNATALAHLDGQRLALVCERSEGSGDLRFYAAVQTYSALALLLALVFPKRYTRTSDLAVVVGFYALAKALETLDKPILAMGHIVSGHTLKHLAAAGAGYWILRMLQKRQPVFDRSSAVVRSNENQLERV